MSKYVLYLLNAAILKWPLGLQILTLTLVAILIVLLLLLTFSFVIWIKSLLKDSCNSMKFTGEQLSKVYLEKYSVDTSRIRPKHSEVKVINIQSKLLYLKTFLYYKGNFTLRLQPWVFKRKSLFTMSTAVEKAWSISDKKANRFKSSAWEFTRLALPLGIFVSFVITLFHGLSAHFTRTSQDDKDLVLALIFSIITSIALISFMIMQSIFYIKTRKEICTNLKGLLYDQDIKKLNYIYLAKLPKYLLKELFWSLFVGLWVYLIVEWYLGFYSKSEDKN